jgi:hypothetical protein
MEKKNVINIKCFNCKKDLNNLAYFKITRRETCYSCEADLHSCKMCEFYDTTSYNDCRESNADRIVEKEKANFCDYFSLNKNCEEQGNAKEELMNKANSIFKE